MEEEDIEEAVEMEDVKEEDFENAVETEIPALYSSLHV